MDKTQHYVVGVSHIDMAFVMREEAQEEMIDILLERITGGAGEKQGAYICVGADRALPEAGKKKAGFIP